MTPFALRCVPPITAPCHLDAPWLTPTGPAFAKELANPLVWKGLEKDGVWWAVTWSPKILQGSAPGLGGSQLGPGKKGKGGARRTQAWPMGTPL